MSSPTSLFTDKDTAQGVVAALQNNPLFAVLVNSDLQGGNPIAQSNKISTVDFDHLQSQGAKAGDHLLVQRRDIRIKKADILASVKNVLPNFENDDNISTAVQLAVAILRLQNAKWDDTTQELVATYTHHGIVLSSGDIVHFTSEDGDDAFNKGNSKFMRTHYAVFLGNSATTDVEVVPYDKGHYRFVSETLALLLVDKHQSLAQYKVLSFNCEHFATIIRNGQFASEQVEQLEKRIKEMMEATGQVIQRGVEVAVDGVGRLAMAVQTFVEEKPEVCIVIIAALLAAAFLARSVH